MCKTHRVGGAGLGGLEGAQAVVISGVRALGAFAARAPPAGPEDDDETVAVAAHGGQEHATFSRG